RTTRRSWARATRARAPTATTADRPARGRASRHFRGRRGARPRQAFVRGSCGARPGGRDASRKRMKTLLSEAAQRAIRYLERLDERAVFPTPEGRARLAALGGPLPDAPSSDADVLALLDDVASSATVASAGRRYFGFVTGGALPATVAASWLATAWDQNCFTATMSPAVAAIEQVALGWLLEVLGLPRDAGGAFVTGATMANLAGLAAARRAVLARAGWDVDEDGLQGGPRVRVVIGAEAHSTLRKALGILGL